MIVYAVGELLRQWRQRRGLSQLDLAIAADVSARHVSLVETGRSKPSADMILRRPDRLHVSVLRSRTPAVLTRLLTDAALRDAAAQVGREIAAMPDPADLVPRLAALAR
ncbi:Helix-turn-helix domain-containing protein [Micromonospora echinaurantiaca]|uniref:Helix-turn-helix domain-containing protein n=1 Tax=Micromonospora echinaurantiaca TaxID=47857 RepID=A0A1C5J319_9ACTN|nr:Helix-turn-helix domain-containing protein [Micromonospora echinaurantiaca]